MTLKLLSFLGSLILTGLVYVLIMFALDSAFPLKSQTLTEKENIDAVNFYTTLVTIALTAYIVVRLYKTNRRFSAIGMCIPALFALYGLFELGQTYADNLNYYQPFDKTKWMSAKAKPFKMAKTLIKSKALNGKTKQEVIDMLGPTDDVIETEKADYLGYLTTNSSWVMEMYFKNDKIVDVYLYESALCL